MIVVSKFSSAFSALFIILTIFLVTLSHKFYENHQTKFLTLLPFFSCCRCCSHGFWNLACFFLGLEVLSIALYVLASSNRASIKSNEAGLNILMGSLHQVLFYLDLLDYR
jgi:NADH-quinone oxidoreductase subunit N